MNSSLSLCGASLVLATIGVARAQEPQPPQSPPTQDAPVPSAAPGGATPAPGSEPPEAAPVPTNNAQAPAAPAPSSEQPAAVPPVPQAGPEPGPPNKKTKHRKDKNIAGAAAAETDEAKADTTDDVGGGRFAGDAFDDGGGYQLGQLNFRTLLQVQYRQTFANPSHSAIPGYAVREDVLVKDGDGYDLQRFFLRIGSDPVPQIGFNAILDFAKLSNPQNVLKQAYVTVRPAPKHVEVAAGVMKLPYSTMELDPIARFELSDLGSTDDLIKNLGFGGRDVGAELMVAPLPKPKLLSISLGAFAGHAKDEHASPAGALGGRLESKPFKGLRLGVDAVLMPTSNYYKEPFDTSKKDVVLLPTDPAYPREKRWASGKAISADVSFARGHFTFRTEGLLGDRIDVETRYDARTWWALWALMAYDVHAGWLRVTPVVRAEWLDSDRQHGSAGRRELSGGLAFPYKKHLRLLFDVRRTDVQAGTPVLDSPKPIPLVPYSDISNTRISVQLQAEI